MLIKNRAGRIVEVSPERADYMITNGEGFKIEEVKPESVMAVNELMCPYCGKECASKIGAKKHIDACKKKHL